MRDRLLNAAQTLPGRAVIIALFSLLLWIQESPCVLELGLALFIISAFPTHRRSLIAVATAYWALRYSPFDVELQWLAETYRAQDLYKFRHAYFAGFLFLSWLCITLARRMPDGLLFKRPVQNLLLIYVAAIAAASYAPLPSPLVLSIWIFVIISGKYLWYMAYALADRKAKSQLPAVTSLFHFQPFWGNLNMQAWGCTNVPFPKGEAYLRRIEAKDPAELAVSQLKGLKLMVWSTFLWMTLIAFNQVIFGAKGSLSPYLSDWPVFPTLNQAIGQYLAGNPFPRSVCWMLLITNFTSKLLTVTIWGGTFIAACRMAGFNALRNTYKPLFAGSIAEFYNRLYYYFKELLVEFFFYPAYFRYFKQHPRLRIFFATFAAAGLGNILFHFLRDITFVIHFGLWKALVGFQVYIVYGIILGTAIGLSQLRSIGRPPESRSLVTSLFVLCFYCLIMVLDDPVRAWTIVDYGSFMVNLFVPFAR